MGQPMRRNQKMSASGLTTQLIYTRQQFLNPGQQFLEGFQAGGTGQPVKEGIVAINITNGALSSIESSED
jgi:hypothetical protein